MHAYHARLLLSHCNRWSRNTPRLRVHGGFMAYMACTDGDNTRGRISILHHPQSRLGIWRLGIRDSIRVMHGYDAQPLPRRGEAPAGREPALFCTHLQAESLHSFVATCRQRASRAASQCDSVSLANAVAARQSVPGRVAGFRGRSSQPRLAHQRRAECASGCGGLKRQRGAGSWICEHEAHANLMRRSASYSVTLARIMTAACMHWLDTGGRQRHQ